MRVYQLAKELNLSSKEMMEKLDKIGCPVTSHMSLLPDDVVKKLKVVDEKKVENSISQIRKDPVTPSKSVKTPETKIVEVKKTVAYEEDLDEVIEDDFSLVETAIDKQLLFPGDDSSSVFGKAGNRFASGPRPRRRKKRRFQKNNPSNEQDVAITEIKIDGDLTVAQIAGLTGKPIPTVVLAFLKKGKMYTVNHVVPKKEVIDLCKNDFEINVIESANPEPVVASLTLRSGKLGSKADLRMPIVVVMGHVDHGKTSLLDYIRKSTVAAGEAGGITQKISAYQVKTTHGEIVFIDTPGHEAFTLMRRCGAKITDIALVVIAADDGIKPQTEEALLLAKKTGAQIIIALNKIDKPGLEKNIENIKDLLSSKYDILIEEWGGDVIVAPVSAKTGEGIDHLLEMIALQSEIMDLKGFKDNAARGFVLESFVQKGLGPVSSVIITEGELKRGDSFSCGKTYGKVKVIENAFGKNVDKAGPSNLVKVVGFEALAEPGDVLMVQDAKEISKKNLALAQNSASQQLIFSRGNAEVAIDKDAEIRVILKVGTGGSLDAIVKAFEKACSKNPELKKRLIINKTSVGDVSCSDVILAEDTDSQIFTFATGVERTAAEMASEKKMQISNYSIIYKLVEAVELLVKNKVDQETVFKEVGRAEVIKIFEVKGKGVIAGCKVVDGRIVRNGKVVCQRNNKVIAEAEISSLQHSKKSASEVKKGFECGFMTENFHGWQEGDTVICLEPVKRGSINT